MSVLLNRWSSSFSFIISAIGAAIGLGNIWRFPYIVGQSGGGTYIIIYLLCVLGIGVPIFIAEVILGRHAKDNLIDGLQAISPQNNYRKFGKFLGNFSLVTLSIILIFYSIVSGWVLFYLKNSLIESSHYSGLSVNDKWVTFTKDYKAQFFSYTFFVISTFYIIGKGVQKGLEKLNIVLMPLLLLLLIFLALYSSTYSSGFYKTFEFIFHFDASKINSSLIIQAIGQAFFSMAVGAGAIFVYGTYLSNNTSIPISGVLVAISQLIIGILAGLAIFPVIFAKGLPLDSGPSLIFIIIPQAFAFVNNSNLIIVSFFVLLLFAAITSSVNIGEPLVATFASKSNISKKNASFLICIIILFAGIPVILYSSIMDAMINLTINFMLPLGGIFYAIFAGYILNKHNSLRELDDNKTLHALWYFLIRYIIPVVLIIFLIFA